MTQKSSTGTATAEVSSQIPSQATFTLVLSKVLEGQPVIPNAKCEFSYIWNFDKNMGIAHLNSINGVAVDITLHPLGISGILGFMSDMPPTPIVINGQKVILYRIILDIYLNSGQRTAAIMFNQNGSTIEVTDNWNSHYSAGLSN